MTTVDEQLIQEVRQRVLHLVSRQPHHLTDEQDVDRQVRSRDGLIRLFCKQSVDDRNDRDVDGIADRMLQTLMWRKSFGLTSMQASDFPLELWTKGYFLLHEDEKRFIGIWDSVRYKRFSDKWAELVLRFMQYVHDRHLLEAVHAGKHVIIVTSLKGMSSANLDLKRDTENVMILDSHFPCLVDEIGGFGAPWFLTGVGNAFVRMTLPPSMKKRFQLHSKDSVVTAFPPGLLPEPFGGTLRMRPPLRTTDCSHIRPLRDWGPDHGFEEREIDRILEYFKHLTISA